MRAPHPAKPFTSETALQVRKSVKSRAKINSAVIPLTRPSVVRVEEEPPFIEGKSAEICGASERPRTPFAHMAHKPIYGLLRTVSFS